MKWVAVFLFAVGLASPAAAENCSKSREYILDGLAGDLAKPAANYRTCSRSACRRLQLRT